MPAVSTPNPASVPTVAAQGKSNQEVYDMRKWLIVLAVLLVVELAIAFSPLAEGQEGTTQDMVGDVVWSAIFVTVPLLVVVGIVSLVRRERA